ncbi:MAG: phosphoribosylformylglycinamidine synthase subunit PurL [Microcoleus sp. PH2017_10_PVI_O_A]|uniref:phosphoribosylformylglycinamidine synthase subunit PurL n=1 Tax=unclassified Microcoleus TaxID=2642155 RepID=UPI001E00DA5A|nr:MULTISPECIES: phosphoribosylformylglycinamidine synthase subunit PurL [unclassified Microcoleus]TAE85567.1 MAG: phosphoribosylformylglycinamidine synthase subunit PurL [Oscillatoriales cyanobacterium]MCC3404654.1 phosphoribosylformylglycinamidine synthase subunit PurL [Microcoleus sp. PH2017_10_PVI_O_A]MCC3458680.1 phosphoribosylformylglycinamidine synthase subunit PurL [Microcoleus sp. PH2017_11_PCY_U_A]MCC3476946.1 phosphoribosylformylglycinamidine synthase subunit PurL [Microcoleus sp. PH
MSNLPFSPEQIAAERLKPEEYEEIVQRLGRHPNKAELGMFGVMWSEHCCYKNSRPLLKQFPTEGDRILVGPGENAGVVDLGDGLQLAFKIESHNHPSAVEPFQGAATGVGGILRDIFTMGARPIALLNSLRFGNLDDSKTQRLFKGVVSGISHYGNCIGVPTVGGEVYFNDAYAGNPLVNVMALGLMETQEIVKSGASGTGNPVLYVGSTTGRDGMGGASFASAELTDKSMDDRPAVQVGDPFLEKSLIEACLAAFKTGAVVAAQDMGAAGITCSTSEMAAKGGVGIEFDLDKVPVRESGMVPYEYLLSESQERMLFVAHKGREQELIDIFHRWGLHAVVAGTVIEEPIVRILFKGEIAAEITATALADNTPIYHRELLTEPPEYAMKAWEWTADKLPECTAAGIDVQGDFQTWNQILLTLLDTPTIASKRWVYRQYDHQVQNNTVVLPGGADAAVVRLRSPETSIVKDKSSTVDAVSEAQEIVEADAAIPLFSKGQGREIAEVPAPLDSEGHVKVIPAVAATVDCNSRYVYLDPYEGAKAVVAEAARNLSCVGAEPLAVTDNLNFGSPEKPVGYWQLASACRGIADACRELGTPVTGGNVSLYNETVDAEGNPQPIYPTPVIGMVGLIPDLTKICGQAWQKEGDLIYLLGIGASSQNSDVQTSPTLGGSEYLAAVHGTIAGKPPVIDFELERQVQKACRDGIRSGWVCSAHDCAEGGIAIALAECCISAKLGATIHLYPNSQQSQRWDELLFGEMGNCILVSVSPAFEAAWTSYLQEHLARKWQKIGLVGTTEASLRVFTTDKQPLIEVNISDLGDRYYNAIERRIASV